MSRKSLFRILKIIAIAPFACVLLFALFIALMQFDFMYHPEKRLANAVGLEKLNENIQVEAFTLYNMGIDSAFLWRIRATTSQAMDALLKASSLHYQSNANASGCLSVSSNDSPEWYPGNRIEYALWNERNYQVYSTGIRVVRSQIIHRRVCLFRSSTDPRIAYVQNF